MPALLSLRVPARLPAIHATFPAIVRIGKGPEPSDTSGFKG